MSSQEETDLVDCPICFNKFTSNTIENHVNKCLFLTESTSDTKTQVSKRASFFDKPINKKPRNSLQSQKNENVGGNQAKIEKNTEANDKKLNSSFNVTQREHENISSSRADKKKVESLPLAEKMRPTNIISYIGQAHAIGQKSMLYQLLNKMEIPNIILWGPPGCGKTSLANVIENMCKHSPNKKYHFVKISPAVSGVNDVKKVVEIASNYLKFGKQTVIFLDEIHRFSKTQQDIFLPHIESGTITLIGATTENPSYSLNAALLSRCRVIVMEKLSIDNLYEILEKAVKSLGGAVCEDLMQGDSNDYFKVSQKDKKFFVDKNTIKWLAETSDGDARIALGGLELAIQCKNNDNDDKDSSDDKKSVNQALDSPNFITLDHIKESLKKSHMLYDKKGDQHYDLISALHKSVRASDVNASLYWITRMMIGGEDPAYIARRMVRMASEDVGLKDPKALVMAVQTMQACKTLGMPESEVLLAKCATYLARAPKSRLMEDALRAAQKVVSGCKDAQPSVPIHLRNIPTASKIDFDAEMSYMPEEIGDMDFLAEN